MKTNNMEEYIIKPFVALTGTISGLATFSGILQGVALFFGCLTALFSALYWYKQWRKSADEHTWSKEDRERMNQEDNK